jgi:hypothetical protein
LLEQLLRNTTNPGDVPRDAAISALQSALPPLPPLQRESAPMDIYGTADLEPV